MTSADAHNYLVAYDIVDTRRRDRVAKRLQAYGDRVQYSVFWVRANPAKLIRLQASVASVLNRQEDSLLICDLGPANASVSDRVTVLGRSWPSTEEGRFIV
jgi:CRISPR-associated protein Cas2